MKRKTPTPSKLLYIWRKAFAAVDGALTTGKAKAGDASQAFLDAWIKSMSNPVFPVRPVRRLPASETLLRQTESRLGLDLPVQLQHLYKTTDGLDWIKSEGDPMSFGGHFPPLEKLALAASLNPPLSERLLQHWKLHRSEAEPQTIELHRPGVLAFLSEPLATIAYTELDQYLALQTRTDAICLLIATKDGMASPIGSVVEVENLTATVYSTLAHWFAAQVEMYRVVSDA